MAQTLRVVIRDALGELYERDPERLLSRVGRVTRAPRVGFIYFSSPTPLLTGEDGLKRALARTTYANSFRSRIFRASS